MCRSLSRVNIWKTDGGKREGAALNVYSSVFMFLSAPFREMEPYGAGWGHMVVIHMAPMAMRKKAFMGRNNGPGGWDEPVLDSYIPVPTRGWGS